MTNDWPQSVYTATKKPKKLYANNYNQQFWLKINEQAYNQIFFSKIIVDTYMNLEKAVAKSETADSYFGLVSAVHR